MIEQLSDMVRWQSAPVEWLDKELAWLMSDSKSARCRASEDDILRSSQIVAQRGDGKVGFGGF